MIYAYDGKSTETFLHHSRSQVGFNEFELREASFSSSHCNRKSGKDSQSNPHVGVNFCQLLLMQEGQEFHVCHVL